MKVAIQDIHIDETPQIIKIFEEIGFEATSFKYYELENPEKDTDILVLAGNNLAEQFIDSKPFFLTIVGTVDLKEISHLTSNKNFLGIISSSANKHKEASSYDLKSVYIKRRYNFKKEDIQTTNYEYKSIISIITNYPLYWPEAYKQFEKIYELNPHLEIKHYGSDGWINDVEKIKEAKYLLHIKYRGHVCNAVVKSLALGVPVIMDTATYEIGSYYGYVKHGENGMVFDTAEEISEYINCDKDFYKNLKENCVREAEGYHFNNKLTEYDKSNLLSLINI